MPYGGAGARPRARARPDAALPRLRGARGRDGGAHGARGRGRHRGRAGADRARLRAAAAAAIASLRAPLVMNPQGMEEHKARGLKRLALTRLRAALARGGAARRSRGGHRRGHARRGAALSRRRARARWSCCPTASTSTRSPRLTPPDPRGGGGGGAARAARRGRRCCSRSAASRAYKGFDDVPAALAVAARPGTRCRPALGLGDRRRGPGDRRACGAAARPSVAPHVHFAGRVERRAAARALRARRPLRARHALRGLEPGHAGGDGARPPVVATRAGGIPDKVVEGETGLLVRARRRRRPGRRHRRRSLAIRARRAAMGAARPRGGRRTRSRGPSSSIARSPSTTSCCRGRRA